MPVSTKPPTGTRDFLPEAMAHRREVIRVIEEVYQRYGFEPLETPAIENLSTLLGKYGEEGDQLIFRLLHRGDKLGRLLTREGGEPLAEKDLGDLGLRYDLTVPLARVVAEYQAQLPRFFRRYQIQPVWRADRPGRGRFREFYQCDVDIVGSASMAVEVELLSAVCEVFDRLGFENVRVRINHRELLKALVLSAGISLVRESEALVALDKLDKLGAEGVLAELVERGFGSDSTEALKPFLDGEIRSGGAEVLERLATRLGEDVHASKGIGDLRQILELSAGTPAAGRLVVDPVLARGLSYYTGPIFEVTVADLSGSLAGGGRYDELVGMFLGKTLPACGIALGLERILVVMSDRGMFASSSNSPEALVTCFGEEMLSDGLSLASELRAQGMKVETYPEPAKLGKQLKYASDRSIPMALILGPAEIERGVVLCKELATGVQHQLPRPGLAAAIRSLGRVP
ncbi:MAG: histidine--tRNA ligase [Polyangia bacterium]|jgi:histidyl-tRNA synthetase|nr:histidine--tRNA ligase [Polyangia bacterium]